MFVLFDFRQADEPMKPQRVEPGPGQESVWDYPRPPRLEESSDRVRVIVGEWVIADSTSAKRVLETSHPPVYYIPPMDIDTECLRQSQQQSFCEWKGKASYYDVWLPGKVISNAAWFYAQPTPRFETIEGYLAFYPSKVDACFVGSEQVRAQPGDFYGGWITSQVVGPFKGDLGTMGW